MNPLRSLRPQSLVIDNSSYNNGLGITTGPFQSHSLPRTNNPSQTSLELHRENLNRRIRATRIGAVAAERRATVVNAAAPLPQPSNTHVHGTHGPPISTSIDRQPTLFTKNASTERKMAELKVVLGKEPSGRLHANAKALPLNLQDSGSTVALEQAKTRARVKLDLLLDNGVCVEGGYLKGKVIVNVRSPMNKEGPTFLAQGKVRVVGFEAIPHDNLRFTFYHCGALLDNVSPFSDCLYNSQNDATGFRLGRVGRHVLPFAMRLPSRHPDAPVAKGVYESRTNGSSIRYIAMVSIKVKDVEGDETSIAHFYRYLELWPLLDPLRILAPSPTPVYANTSKGVFLGGPGTIKLTASIHREAWVAGQRCFVKVFIANDTEKKRVQSVTLNLIRTETMFVPNPDAAIQDGALVHNDSDACRTSTTKRIVSKSVLEMGESAVSRHVTASGWWTGVPPSSSLEFNHNILIPPLALTIPRSRLLEVEFTLEVRVGTGALSSEVSISLPIRIINYISLDPLPAFGPPEKLRGVSEKTAVSFVVQRPSNLTQLVEGESVFSRNRAESEPLQPPILPFVPADSGTYRGSVEMPQAGRLQICNRTSRDMSLSVSNGFPPAATWIDRSPQEQTAHALPESDDGLVEPERPPSQSDLLAMIFGVTHVREPHGVSTSGTDQVVPPVALEVDFQDETTSTFLDEKIRRTETQDDTLASSLDILQFPIPSPPAEESPVKVLQGTWEEEDATLFQGEESISSRNVSPRNSTDTARTSTSERPSFSWSGDANVPSSAPTSQGSSAMTTPNETRVVEKGDSKTSPMKRLLPQRPRPHPAFMARMSGSHVATLPLGLSRSKKTTIDESADLSQSEVASTLVATEPDGDAALQNAASSAKGSTEVITSTSMNEVPATVSALMRQDLKTPVLPSHQEPEVKGAAVFERSFATPTRPERVQETKTPAVTLSSIKGRIAMFEQRMADEKPQGRSYTVHVPFRQSRVGPGDPFRSKRV